LFVALADDLEEQISSSLVYRQISELIQDQQLRAYISFKFCLELLCGLCGRKGIDDIYGYPARPFGW